mgnify:FL=1|tara:strand:- start:3494 stop:4573 length:1080 start_codon:yes stop_codon:yes gene_type:complete
MQGKIKKKPLDPMDMIAGKPQHRSPQFSGEDNNHYEARVGLQRGHPSFWDKQNVQNAYIDTTGNFVLTNDSQHFLMNEIQNSIAFPGNTDPKKMKNTMLHILNNPDLYGYSEDVMDSMKEERDNFEGLKANLQDLWLLPRDIPRPDMKNNFEPEDVQRASDELSYLIDRNLTMSQIKDYGYKKYGSKQEQMANLYLGDSLDIQTVTDWNAGKRLTRDQWDRVNRQGEYSNMPLSVDNIPSDKIENKIFDEWVGKVNTNREYEFNKNLEKEKNIGKNPMKLNWAEIENKLYNDAKYEKWIEEQAKIHNWEDAAYEDHLERQGLIREGAKYNAHMDSLYQEEHKMDEAETMGLRHMSGMGY